MRPLIRADILAREITYSTDKHLAVNLVTIHAARAHEIIELNKQGVKVEQLTVEKQVETPKKEYVELVGQDSLTRFDKSKKKKNTPKTANSKSAPKGNNNKANSSNKGNNNPKNSNPQPNSKVTPNPSKNNNPRPANKHNQRKRPKGNNNHAPGSKGGNNHA